MCNSGCRILTIKGKLKDPETRTQDFENLELRLQLLYDQTRVLYMRTFDLLSRVNKDYRPLLTPLANKLATIKGNLKLELLRLEDINDGFNEKGATK